MNKIRSLKLIAIVLLSAVILFEIGYIVKRNVFDAGVTEVAEQTETPTPESAPTATAVAAAAAVTAAAEEPAPTPEARTSLTSASAPRPPGTRGSSRRFSPFSSPRLSFRRGRVARQACSSSSSRSRRMRSRGSFSRSPARSTGRGSSSPPWQRWPSVAPSGPSPGTPRAMTRSRGRS